MMNRWWRDIHRVDLCCVYWFSLHVPIQRGQALWPYNFSVDGRLLEMDFEALVYEKNSPWQNIQIIRTRISGNALFLDGEPSQ